MAPRKPIPPPVKCGARSKRTGGKCGRWATPGLYPPRCHFHGGAPGTGAPPPHDAAGKAEAGRYMATLVDRLNGERRPVWAVIADAVHHADALMVEARAQIEAGNLSPDALERLESATRLAHGLAAAAVTTRAAELQGQAAAVWSDRMAGTIHSLIADWLGLPPGSTPVQEALTGALSEIDPEEGAAPRPPAGWQTWTDQVAGELAAVLAPRLGLTTEAVRRWLVAAIAAAGWRPLPDLPGAALALPAAEPAAPEPVPEPAAPEPVPNPQADELAPVVDPEPEPEPTPEPIRPAEPDHLSEEIEHLERHHTATRTAQAAKLRRVRDRRITTTLGAGPAGTEAPTGSSQHAAPDPGIVMPTTPMSPVHGTPHAEPGALKRVVERLSLRREGSDPKADPAPPPDLPPPPPRRIMSPDGKRVLVRNPAYDEWLAARPKSEPEGAPQGYRRDHSGRLVVPANYRPIEAPSPYDY